ncbi:hypothetical protein WDW89_08345 [Deltaproteobacteria bacterium TL4]
MKLKWWSHQFWETFQTQCEPYVLARARPYVSKNKIHAFALEANTVHALVVGSKNPVLEIAEGTEFEVRVEFAEFMPEEKEILLEKLGHNLNFIHDLKNKELSESLLPLFEHWGYALIPRFREEFELQCHCPDWNHPCEHTAGVLYYFAREVSKNPMLLFEIRGFSKAELLKKMEATPEVETPCEQEEQTVPLEKAEFLYPQVSQVTVPESMIASFWKTASDSDEDPISTPPRQTSRPSPFFESQNDYPDFWNQPFSFRDVLNSLYQWIRNAVKI